MSLPLVQEQTSLELKRQPLWRTILRRNFTRLDDLISFLELSEEQQSELDVSPEFILNLPRRLAEKIEKRSLTDPLFLQFVPLKKEQISHPEYVQDPVMDARFVREEKLLQKYSGRALIISTSACAMHCRYCFRKNFNYQTQDKTFENELETIQNDATLEEIILSGGDPLSLSNETLEALLKNLSNIAHVRRIRFHTRFPIGIPERLDSELLAILKECPKQIWFVIHANHPQEFDQEIWDAIKRVQFLGIPVLNQSVLLRGVNDNPETLHALCQELIDHGITPYYLHQLDQVQGSSHFAVPTKVGLALSEYLNANLPGYAVPKFVQEIPGKSSKTVL
jgi:EF-P beta-lysylation protein EpmB